MSKRRKKPKAIWAVGGGKGGTGKTFLASNMGIYLAKLGQRVLLVDADLGGANLHTCLGLTGFRSNLSDFLYAGQRDVTDFVEETDVLNLYLLPGALDSPGIRPSIRDLERLKVALNGANMDYVIMDLGSGTSREVMDLFLAGDVGIYVTVPEPTSIENTYRFLMESHYWILMQGNSKRSFKNAVQRAFRSHDFRGVPQMLQRLIAEEPLFGKTLEACMRDFSVRLILNQVRRSEEIEVGFAIRSAIKKYFGVPVDFVGYVDFDDQVLQCVHMRKSLLQNFPESNAAKCIANLTNKLLTAGNLAFDFR
jgi:flagellar biosynthesis protein FlhG